MSDVWRTHLTTLRHQFETAATRYPQLNCILIHTSKCANFVDALKACPYTINDATSQSYFQPFGKGARAYWLTMEDKKATEIFWALAGKAGTTIGGLSRQDAQRLRLPDAIMATKDAARWLFVMFEIAWQQQPGFPVKADIHPIGFMHWEAMANAAFNERNFPKAKRIVQDAIDVAYYSRIHGVFGASVDVIDVILAENPGHKGSGKQPPKKHGGSKPKYDAVADARMANDWAVVRGSRRVTIKEWASEIKKPYRELKAAIERHRKRK